MSEKFKSIDSGSEHQNIRQIRGNTFLILAALLSAQVVSCNPENEFVRGLTTLGNDVELEQKDGTKSICPVKPSCVGSVSIFDSESKIRNCIIVTRCKPPLK